MSDHSKARVRADTAAHTPGSTRRRQRGAVTVHSGVAMTMPSAGFLARLFAKRSVRPGEQFGAPGQGRAGAIAASTVISVLALWLLVTNMGWVKPLFLPSPQAVLAKFVEVSNEGFAGRHAARAHRDQSVPGIRRLRTRLRHRDPRSA